MLEPTVERLSDGIEVAIGECTHRLDAALDPKDFLVDAQHRLQMTVLVGDLRREQKLQLVLRCYQQEGSEQPRDVKLGMEAVREDPQQPALLPLVERVEAPLVCLEVELQR